jgi:chemotaxis protein CheY-P-specific phosphatase CheC
MTTKDAVTQLCDDLRNDKDLFFAWQSNIAMAFYDEMSGRGIGDNLEIHKSELHEAVNNAAKSFLNALIKK